MKIFSRAVSVLLAAALMLSAAFACGAAFDSSAPEPTCGAAIVIELNSGTVVYEKNADDKMYPASTTKLMTALIAAERIDSGAITLYDTITFSYDAVYGIPRDTMHISIEVGEELTVQQVLYAMLLPSANEACLGMAEYIAGSVTEFIDLMNARAAELGMTNSHFVTANGLHDDDHYMSARDLATLLTECVSHPLLREIMSAATYTIPATNKCAARTLVNTNKLIISSNANYNSKVVCGKTGYTTPAGNTLATYSEYNGLKLVTVLMKASQGTIFPETSALVNHFADSLTLSELTDTISLAVSVKTADGGAVMAEPASGCKVLLRSGMTVSALEKRYSLPDTISSSVAAGDKLGTVSFYDGSTIVGTADMLARSSYGAASTGGETTASEQTTAPAETDASGNPVSRVTAPTSPASEGESGGGFWRAVGKFVLILLLVAVACALLYIAVIGVSLYMHKKKRSAAKAKNTGSNQDNNNNNEGRGLK